MIILRGRKGWDEMEDMECRGNENSDDERRGEGRKRTAITIIIHVYYFR
jgi:hypothetical protein